MKRLITTTICLTIAIALIIPAFAFAQFPSASEIASSMVNHVMGAFIDLSANFARIAGSLLNWVISPEFISFSYTNPSGPNANPIVATGLDITKNFVNLGIVIALVFIAISISLQLKEYGTKQAFIKLIVAALLVNFAPVLVGLIVDAANITMNFFLEGIRNDISGALTDINNESLIGALTRPGTVKPFSLLVRGAVLMGLYISIGFAFLLMVFVFVFRYIAIWILVILSPLAFIAWAFPSDYAKKLWSMWWQQIFQWSFIGIPMAFFLYLAASAMPIIKSRFESKVIIPGAESSIVGIVDQTFPYFVIVAFIYIGFFVGLKATAFGSSSAIRAAQWSRKKVPRLAGSTLKTGWRGTKLLGKKMKLDQRRIGGRRGMSVRELAGVATRNVQHVPFARWFLPEKVRKYAEYWPTVKKAQTEAAEHSTQTVMSRVYSKADVHEKALGNILHTLDSVDSQVIFDEARKSHIGKNIAKEKGIAQTAVTDEHILDDKEWNKIMARPLQIAVQSGKLETDVLRKDPRLSKVAARAGLLKSGDPDNNWQEIIVAGDKKDATPKQKEERDFALSRAVAKTTSQVRGNYLNYTEPETYDDLDATGAAMSEFDRDRLFQVNRVVKNGQTTMLKTMDKLFSDFVMNHKNSPLKGMKFNDIAKTLAIKGMDEDEASIIHENEKAYDEVWHEFHKYIEDQYGNDRYFAAVEDRRVRQTSWRKAIFAEPGKEADTSKLKIKIPKEDKEKDKKEDKKEDKKDKGSGGSSTVGKDMGMGTPPAGYKASKGGIIVDSDYKEPKRKGKKETKSDIPPKPEEPKPKERDGYRKRSSTKGKKGQTKINPLLTDSQIAKLRKKGWPDEKIKGLTSSEQADILIYG